MGYYDEYLTRLENILSFSHLHKKNVKISHKEYHLMHFPGLRKIKVPWSQMYNPRIAIKKKLKKRKERMKTFSVLKLYRREFTPEYLNSFPYLHPL